MHKCFRCGTEFEGYYCPECGTQWQEQKHCPNCGAVLAGSTKFCNVCGYSFIEQTDRREEKKASGFKGFMKKAGVWLKKHFKIVIPVTAAVLVLIVLLSLIPTFQLASVNGTYYKLAGGKFDEDDYVVLSTGKWNDGETKGTYSLKSGKLRLHADELDDLFGEELSTREGQIENGVIKFKDQGYTEVYCKKSHKHKYGEWETVYKPTCVSKGLNRRICFCETQETEQVEATAIHTVENGACSVCDQLQLTYTLNEDGRGYTVTGFSAGFEKSETVEIFNTYNNLSVTGIADGAFENCSGLKSVTIGENMRSIGCEAFKNCSNLTSVTFNNVKFWQFSSTDSDEKGTAVDLSNPAKAAEYLTGNYCDYYLNKWYMEKAFDTFIERIIAEKNYGYYYETKIIGNDGEVNIETRTYEFDDNVVYFKENSDRRGIYWYSEGDSFYQLKYSIDDSKYHKTYADEIVADEIILNKLKLATVTDYNEDTKEYTVTIGGETYLMKISDGELTFYDEEKLNVYVLYAVGSVSLTIPSGKKVVDDTLN